MRLLLASLTVLLSGCASYQVSVAEISGEYERGGFNEMTTLLLRKDGSYKISQSLVLCEIDPQKGFTICEDEESGRWSLDSGIIKLETSAQAPREYYTWFSRLRLSRTNGVSTLISDAPTAPIYGRWAFTQKKPAARVVP